MVQNVRSKSCTYSTKCRTCILSSRIENPIRVSEYPIWGYPIGTRTREPCGLFVRYVGTMMLTFLAEISFARLYAVRNPTLAAECARTALDAARDLDNPALVAEALAMIHSLPTGVAVAA